MKGWGELGGQLAVWLVGLLGGTVEKMRLRGLAGCEESPEGHPM